MKTLNLKEEPFDFSSEFDDYENGLLGSDPGLESEFDELETGFSDFEAGAEIRLRPRVAGLVSRGPHRHAIHVHCGQLSDHGGSRPGSSMNPQSVPVQSKRAPSMVRNTSAGFRSTLNRLLGLRLPVNGVLTPETRSAIRSFQVRQGVPITGLVGPDTERALIAATSGVLPSKIEELEFIDTPRDGQEWEEEINRNSAEYIRWAQQSLNQILGLKLAADGDIGTQTRSAIRSFQKQAGLGADGIMGEKTEAAMIAKGASAPPQSVAKPMAGPDSVKMRKHKTKPGYSAYGGGSTTAVLQKLKNQGRLDISDGDIEMFHRMSNVETGGVIQGINSYDSAYMSMGFMQWPVLYDDKHGGKLQRLIQMVPGAFKRYGIELSNEKYAIPRSYGTEYSWKIKGAPTPGDLRSEIWAKRFYLAGLDPEVIAAEARLALTVVREGLQKMILFAKQKTGDGRLFERIRAAYDNSPMLRALIQETYNHRPAYVRVALKNVMLAVRPGIGVEELIGVLRQKIREAYPQDADSQKGADHIITKTAKYAPGTEHEFEFDQDNCFGADDHEYEADEEGEAGFLDKYLDRLRFSPPCDRSVTTPGFLVSKRQSLASLLSPSQNARAVQLNRAIHPAKSGVQPADIVTDLKRYVDFDAVRGAIRQQSGGSIVLSEGTVDAVFVEAVHQFQAKVYFDKAEQDGVVGPSTLDSLGIVKHNLRRKMTGAFLARES